LAPGETWTEKIQNLVQFGYEGMEVRLAMDASDHLKHARQIKLLKDDLSIGLSSLVRPTPLFGAPLTNETYFGKLEDLRMNAAIAAILDTPSLMCAEFANQPKLSPFQPLKPISNERRELLLNFLREADGIAMQEGIVFLIEPLNRYESSLYNTIEEAAELCRMARVKQIGLVADTFHMNIEEHAPTTTIKTYCKWIRHIQLGDNNRLLPGLGCFPFQDLFRALKEIEYSGYMTLECITDENNSVSLRQCASFLKDLLGGIA
jgi:sugar phosphate isomerase/epimerase